MIIKQISVFLDNKKGRLAQVTEVLKEAGINIRALYVADTTDYGILRMIVDKPEETKKMLSDAGFTVNTANVIAVTIKDVPGGLNFAVETITKQDISIEYVYAFTGRSDSHEAVVVMKVENADAAIKAMQNVGIKVLTQNDICEMCR